MGNQKLLIYKNAADVRMLACPKIGYKYLFEMTIHKQRIDLLKNIIIWVQLTVIWIMTSPENLANNRFLYDIMIKEPMRKSLTIR